MTAITSEPGVSLDGFGLPYWLDFERPRFPELDQDTFADVAIVGAGIAGLKLAHYLAQHQITSIVLEDGRVGDGASGRNQGSAVIHACSDYAQSIRRWGRPAARALWQLGLENLRLVKALVQQYDIDCGFDATSYTYLVREDTPGWEQLLQSQAQQVRDLQEDGFHARLLDAREAVQHGGGNPIFRGGLSYQETAHFHSGRYVVGLAAVVARSPSVKIYEGTRVTKVSADGTSVTLQTSRGMVSADRAFLMTNALVPQFVPELERSVRCERGQVMVTEPLEQPLGCAGDFAAATVFWREIREPDGGRRLLFGGARRRDEPDSLFHQFDGDARPHPRLHEGFLPSVAHQRRLDAEFARIFPSLKGVRITHRWGGLQGCTADDVPLIGEFDRARRIHGMAGFCGRGNTYTDVGAQYLAGQVAGVQSDIERRFGSLFTTMMQPPRASAAWGPWTSSNV